MHGEFFWYDVMTTDTKAAAAFYTDVVGWGVKDPGAPGMPYTVFTVNQMGVAGLMPIPDEAAAHGAPPCWSGYIAVDDVDAAAAKLERAGGTVHKRPTDVPGIIRFAVVADPQGAQFMIAKGLMHETMPRPPVGAPGTIGWHELYADDGEAAFRFYEAMFGWTKGDAVDMGPMGVYQLFATGDAPVGGMMTRCGEIPGPAWGYYFNVPAIEAAAKRVTGGGGKVLNGPMQVPGGQWIVQCTDPQGAFFSLVASQR